MGQGVTSAVVLRMGLGTRGLLEVTQAAALSRTTDEDPAGFVILTREAQIGMAEKNMSKNLFTSPCPGFQAA